jgi:hypothetical protein
MIGNALHDLWMFLKSLVPQPVLWEGLFNYRGVPFARQAEAARRQAPSGMNAVGPREAEHAEHPYRKYHDHRRF